jgi:putative zinc finger/helix-turn-helix YgiT family protein
MECAVCGAVLGNVTGKRMGYYRDETIEVESEFMRCEACGEQFFTPAQAKAHNRSIKNEVRKKYGLLPPEKIAEIRHKLELTQEELEELLGTGAKVVVRWESGKVIQGRGQDNMLRLLDRDPSVVEDLRQIRQLRDAEQKNNRSNPKRMIAQAV